MQRLAGRIAVTHARHQEPASGDHRGGDRPSTIPAHVLNNALLTVPVAAEGSQRAELSFQLGGGDVVRNQGGVVDVAVGEAGFDPAPTGQQPVEHGEHLVAGYGFRVGTGCRGWSRP